MPRDHLRRQHVVANTLTAIILLAQGGLQPGLPTAARAQDSANDQAVSEPSDVAGTLAAILGNARHPDLKWSHFPYYKKHVERLYELCDGQLLWTRDGRPTREARDVIAGLAEAGEKGLDAADYDAAPLAAALDAFVERSDITANELARYDTAVTLSLMRYISDLHIGKINPRNMHFDLDIEGKKLDLPLLVKSLAEEGRVRERLAEVEPDLRLYDRLTETLAIYRQLAADTRVAPLPDSAVLRPGDAYDAAPELRYRLQALGDLPRDVTAPEGDTGIYDDALATAVKHFQQRHGQMVDGVIGKDTWRHLNTPMQQRVSQIRLALERMRWFPEAEPRDYLIINIPQFTLYAVDFRENDEHRLKLQMNVIVGKALDTHATPIFHGNVRYIEFQPYWNCPRSIIRSEIVPKMERDPEYLGKHHMEMVDHFAWDAKVYEPTPENIEKTRAGVLQVRQKPGPHNSLGPAKFIFPNANNVYLHGTPAQQLFSRSRRAFSHGCIRLEDPAKLAELVLEPNGDWPRDRIDQAMAAERPERALLTDRIPVYLIYTTVVVDLDNQVLFFDDLYGHDARLQQAIDKGYPYEP